MTAVADGCNATTSMENRFYVAAVHVTTLSNMIDALQSCEHLSVPLEMLDQIRRRYDGKNVIFCLILTDGCQSSIGLTA